MKTISLRPGTALVVIQLLLTLQLRAADVLSLQLSKDYSPTTNPSKGWQLGYKRDWAGAFTIYTSRYSGAAQGNTLSYWGYGLATESWVRRNEGPSEFTVDQQGTFPVGGLSMSPGPVARVVDSYAVVRYVIPVAGVYRVAYWGTSTGSSDVDVHVVQDNVELWGRNLISGAGLAWTNEQYYAEGVVLDLAVGRGADRSNFGSILQFDAQVEWVRDVGQGGPQITFVPPRASFSNALDLVISNVTGVGQLRYTVDGTEPSPNSQALGGLLRLESSTWVRAALFNGSTRISEIYGATFENVQDVGNGIGRIPFEQGLATQFPVDSQPREGWSLGFKESAEGDFTEYGQKYPGRLGAGNLLYWGRARNSESWIRKNLSPVPIENVLGYFPAFGLSAAPGLAGRPDTFAVARYTVRSNGVYKIKVFGVGSTSVPLAARFVQDDVILSGKDLTLNERYEYRAERYLRAGTTLDFCVGRLVDRANFGAIIQFDFEVVPLDPAGAAPPDISFRPARASFTNDITVVLSRFPGPGEIRYTVDGTLPTSISPLYDSGVRLTNSTLIQAALFKDGAIASRVYAGAYHKLAPGDHGIPYSWYERYFGVDYELNPLSAEQADADGDGSSNRKEFELGSDPTDPLSGFEVGIQFVPSVIFKSVPGKTYRVIRHSVLGGQGVEIAVVKALGESTRYVDVNAPSETTFYTVEVSP